MNTANTSYQKPDSGFKLVRVCKQLGHRLNRLSQELFQNFRNEFEALDPFRVRQAVREAEALAWQTPYPHLLLPVLAEEKVHAVQRWQDHQLAVRNRAHAHVAAQYDLAA